MDCILNNNPDPFFNLAAEEYLLKQTDRDVFMLWQSSPAVVVGKHQNTLAEINYRFLMENHIPAARRLSGGGTVFHGPGNLNFTFIRHGEAGKLVDFENFIHPVLDFLKYMGIEARRGLKNEILVQDLKISGNAEHIYKNRVLHHGTLLFNADLDMLHEAIRPGKSRYVDKAVPSNRSKVMNVSELLPDMSMADFRLAWMDHFLSYSGNSNYNLTPQEERTIQNLAVSKYSTWEWIYGWSPDYEFHGEWLSDNLRVTIWLKVHRGMIEACNLLSNELPQHLLDKLMVLLTGMPHEEISILTAVNDLEVLQSVKDAGSIDFVRAFF
ncbi:MAG TPA: lipoate--protein ligase [Bacteroidales bacterium]|nr:lipoate--protein ligase [Bacteroidales bacterium]